MEKANVVTFIDNLYASFLTGDLEGILDLVSDSSVWTVYGPAEVPFMGEFRGRSGAKQFLEALIGTQEDVTMEISDRIAQGDKVVFVGNYTATIKATRKTVSTAFAHVWTVEDAKITRFLDFFDTAAAKSAYS
jgi:ketosteroid isomerase-like protein